MNLTPTAMMMCLLLLAPASALGQATDAAAERARLANQRIQAEADRRAREEEQQQKAPTASAAPGAVATTASPLAMTAPTKPVAPVAPVEPPQPPGATPDQDPTTRALDQLRDLGKLKDAGYLTEEEFQRIKTRIIESQF